MSALVRYAVSFYYEIKDFIPQIYSHDKKREDIERLNQIFSTANIVLDEENILFLRTFFGSFMVDSGMKNVIYLKDNRKPLDKIFGANGRYSDISLSNNEN